MILEPEYLQQLQDRSQAYRRQARRIRIRAFVAFVFAIAIVLWSASQISQPRASTYYLEDNEWQEITNDPDMTIDAVYDPTDTEQWYVYSDGCWCVDRYSFESRKWRTDWSGDFIKESNAFETVLVLPDNTAWAAGQTSLMSFDGSQWHLITNSLSPQQPIKLAAIGPQSVVILSADGHLTHIIDGMPHAIALPDDFSGQPSIASFDGSLWLGGSGLWRLDDVKTWTRFLSEDEFRVWNATEAGVWVTSSKGIMVYQPSDTELSQFMSWADLGISAGTPIRGVVGHESPEAIATDKALVSMIYNIPLPATGDVKTLTMASNYVYLTTTGLRTFLSNRLICDCDSDVVLLLPAPLIAMLVFGLPWLYFITERRQHAHKYLMSLLPSLPDYGFGVEPQVIRSVFGWRRIAACFALGIVIAVIGSLLRQPTNLVSLIALIPVALSMMWPLARSLYQILSRQKKRAKPYPPGSLGLALLVYIGFGLGFMVTIELLDELLRPVVQNQLIHDAAVVILTLSVSLIALYGLLTVTLRGTIRALRQADYDQALSRIDHLPLYIARLARFILQALTLQIAGRNEDAEAAWMDTLTQVQSQAPELQAMILYNLAETFESANKPDEAERYCRGTLEIAPDYDRAYLLAIRQAIRMQTPPDLIAPMYAALPSLERKHLLTYFYEQHTWAVKYAQKALIAQYVGKSDEAAALMKVAFTKARKTFKPGMAALYVLQGNLLHQTHEFEAAQRAWTQAIELDRYGASGMAAQQAIMEAQPGPLSPDA